MKKITAILLAALIILSLAACNGSENQSAGNDTSVLAQSEPLPDSSSKSDPIAVSSDPVTDNADAANQPDTDMANDDATADEASVSGGSNILIAYFTVPETDGVDTVAGASRVVIDGQVLGNNQHIANLIGQATDGDLFVIDTVQEYPRTHDPLLDFANVEKGQNARPELATKLENLKSYDVIFLGYPNWWADLPMPLYTFLEEYDFSGKTIIPFTVHGGSGFSNTIRTISELQPSATVITDGLSISRNNVGDAEDDVNSWLQKLGY